MRELTPAQRHRARVLAEQAHAQTPYGQHLESSAYQLMLAKLAADKRTLKGIESVQAKAAMKAKMLPAYADWIAGALAGGGGADDVVLTTCMVWAIDAGAYALALTIAPYVLQHGLPMPDHYQRKAASILVDEMADAYLLGRWNAITYPVPAQGEGETIQQHGTEGAVELLAQALALTQDHDMPDQARAKLYKAVAYAALGKVQTAETVDLDKMPRQALQDVRDLLGTAVALDAMCGVKKDLERIDRKLAADAAGKVTLPTAAQPAEATATPAATNPAPTARKRSTPATQPVARARKR